MTTRRYLVHENDTMTAIHPTLPQSANNALLEANPGATFKVLDLTSEQVQRLAPADPEERRAILLEVETEIVRARVMAQPGPTARGFTPSSHC